MTEAIHPPLDDLSSRQGQRFESFFRFSWSGLVRLGRIRAGGEFDLQEIGEDVGYGQSPPLRYERSLVGLIVFAVAA
ncbi:MULTISPECIES: hypothetical protein [unclassified Mesorhizobium]|uniref:hypothetical protein n=1 Tax=unclassified Mesorhizobium TaxID=325217 RepID=UPI00333B8E36